MKIGEINNQEIFTSEKKTDDLTHAEYKLVKNLVAETIETYAQKDDANTNPGFVLLHDQPAHEMYINAVISIVALQEVTSVLKSLNADYKGYNNCRGLIGATSAVAWDSCTDKTFELIGYRLQSNWGTEREVATASVHQIDRKCPTTFDNFDYSNTHNRLVPKSPCPVLYGVRGDDINELIMAQSIVQSETVESWVIFETNQGTDQHLQKKMIRDIQPYQSVIVEGSVVNNPFAVEGGHVFFSLKDTTGSIDCAAYEPTKEFRRVIRGLSPGDVAEAYGGVREHPLTINLEKINIKSLTKLVEKVGNPVCSSCGKHMKSKGTDQGYKCKRCGTKSNTPSHQSIPRTLHLGFYEVPVCARRHLSKPLKRMDSSSRKKKNRLRITEIE